MQPVSDAAHKSRSANINNLRRTTPRSLKRYSNPEEWKGRKLFSEFLIEFYATHPGRRKALMMKAIEYAEKGNARFLELILMLVEGPPKKEAPSSTTVNFNFLSDSDRERAIQSVSRIKAMSQAIPVLPETIENGDQSTSTDDE